MRRLDTKEEAVMRFKCPYCGTVKEISAFRILLKVLLHQELRVWCDRCFYSTHWHLKLWRKNNKKKEVKQARPEKKR